MTLFPPPDLFRQIIIFFQPAAALLEFSRQTHSPADLRLFDLNSCSRIPEMSEGSKKRKRTDTAGEKPAKVRVLDKNGIPDAKSKGRSKQEKSERRSKKAAKASKKRSTLDKDPELLTADVLPSQPDNLANGDDFISLAVGEPDTPTSESKVSSGKEDKQKAKKDKKDKKEKKEKKSKSKKSKQDPSSQPEVVGDEAMDDDDSKSKKDRFILFIGNLPFTATVAQITNHFIALQPFTVRLSTEKSNGKSKGFAFLEFEGYDKMKTCLKLYHHSIFDPEDQDADEAADPDESFAKRKKSNQEEKPQSKHARRINVELTAGGGGKGKQRKDKIEQKNQKLSEERERRHVKEAAERVKAGHEKKERPATGANADGNSGDNRGNVHPSRLKRVEH